jgi:hypothetical protein
VSAQTEFGGAFPKPSQETLDRCDTLSRTRPILDRKVVLDFGVHQSRIVAARASSAPLAKYTVDGCRLWESQSIHFLASDESGFTVGHDLVIDGCVAL